jgi:hypothetical protein
MSRRRAREGTPPRHLRLLFKARLAEQDKTHPGYAAKFRRLSKLMLAAAGGEEVVPHQEPDGFIDALLKTR